MKRFAVGSLACFAVAMLACPASAGDFILLETGEYHMSKPGSERIPPMADEFADSTITVLEENYDKVVFSLEVNGRKLKQDLDTDKVKEIFYQPRGGAYAEGEDAMNNGNYEVALQKFASVSKSSSERQWVRMNSLANMGDIYQFVGDWKNAIEVWETLVRELPRCRLVPEAFKRIITGSLNLGDIQRAENAAKRLGRLSGLPEGIAGLADYYLIYIRQRQAEVAKDKGELANVLSEYRTLLAKVEDKPAMKEIATRSRLQIGNCLVALEKYSEALDFFQNIAKDAKDKAVLAGAFNGLGLCYLKQQKWKEALLCFLRTEVIYDVSPERTAEALYYSGLCFARMQGAGIGEDAGLRAKIQFRECMRRFPGTPYAQMSEQENAAVRITRNSK